jgi:peptidoglycan/LPS O-acetylase OafA/YrhL
VLADKKHFDFLDGIRGIAILWVILHHAYYSFDIRNVLIKVAQNCQDPHISALLITCNKALMALANYGVFGVDLFFVISGFLITGLLIDFLNGKLDIGRFYLRRFFKIVPHYYFVIFGVLVFYLFVHPWTVWPYVWKAVIPYFYFLQNFGFKVEGLEHTWTLVIEEQFYVFWALALLYISKRFSCEETRWYAALWAAVGFYLFITLNRYLVLSTGTSLVGVYSVTGTLQTSVRADGLMAGCFLRLIWFRYPGFFRNKFRAVFYYLIGVVFLMYLLSMSSSERWGEKLYWYSTTLVAVSACCFICAGLGGADWLYRNTWLRYVGRNSYGIYLLHYPLLQGMLILGWGRAPWLIWIYVPLAIFVGALSTMTVEKYFLGIRKKIAP